jgi:hypothetical protein
MKATLRVTKSDSLLYEGIHDIANAESFGSACSNAWNSVVSRKFSNASSIGALQESLGENMLRELDNIKTSLCPGTHSTSGFPTRCIIL